MVVLLDFGLEFVLLDETLYFMQVLFLDVHLLVLVTVRAECCCRYLDSNRAISSSLILLSKS